MGNREICVGLASIVVSLLLSVAAPPAHALGKDGLWAAQGRWPFSAGLAPRKVPSPAPPAYVTGDAQGLLHVVAAGRDTKLLDLSYNPYLTEVLWSPDGRYLAVTESDGGAVGSFRAFLYRVDRAGTVQRVPIQAAVETDAADLSRDCSEAESPNLTVAAWLEGSRKLLLVASVPNHSVCWNMGALRGYVVSVPDGRILEKLPEAVLRRRYGSHLGREYRWPTVKKQRFSFAIDATGAPIKIEAPIRTREGAVAYWFTCVGGTEEYLDSVGSTHQVFVPDMICTLNETPGVRETTLLTEGTEAPWHTRGQFRWPDLQGACGEYPEYGRVRHFHLLGMELTLAASHVVERQGRVSSFRMDVTVREDPAATTRWVAPSGYLFPHANCRDVRRGIEPAMCRARTGNMTDCRRLREDG